MKRNAAWNCTRTGFTLAEMLVVMAIMAVLSGVAVPSVVHARNSFRQMSLNRSAETIFMTAQRNLIAAKVRGVETIGTDSSDDSDDSVDPDNPGSSDTLASSGTVSSTDEESFAKNTVMSEKTLSPELYNGNWIVKYSNWTVDYVYFSEDVPAGIMETEYKKNILGKVGLYG